MTEQTAPPAIAVTGIGIVTAAGRGPQPTLDALRGAARPPAPPVTITSDLGDPPPVFEVPDAALLDPPTRLPGGRGRRGLRLALIAALDALAMDRGACAAVPAHRVGVVVGTTVGGMAGAERWAESRLGGSPGFVAARSAIRHLPLWDIPNELARRVGAEGPVLAVTTACTGGSQAIATGADLLAAGVCDVVLAGGVDVLCRVTYHGFNSLGLLDRARCRPFDRARAGLNLGEGAAFLVLRRSAAGERPQGYLEGWSSTSDAHHMTAPQPDGSGLGLAAEQALGRAGRAAADVDWVHAHGTGTPGNDGAEARAVARVLAGADVPLSSTKHVFGHTLGAAGAVSAVVGLLACRAGFVPGNAPVANLEPACVRPVVPPQGLHRPVGRVLVNTLGFGGTNCVLVLAGVAR